MSSNRIERINDEIRRELSDLLREVKDPRVQKTMVSVTRVQTTPDLRYAKVFFSVLDKDAAKETLKGLKSAGGWLRRELGAKLQLRYTPELVWEEDQSITHGARIFDILATLDIPEDTDEDLMLKIMAIYSEMQMNIFNSQPIVIAKDVRYETVIEIETRSMVLPGMSIQVGTKRVYPRSTLASQIIGYTGAIPSRAMWLTLSAKGYSYNDTIGRDGIESSMEDWLTQNSSLRKGARVVERDQMSRVVRELSYTAPQDGNNVKLTLNASYQQMAERCLADNVNSTRDLQETRLASEAWREANKTDIHNRDWAKYPLELAEHGCLIVLDMQCRVLALANYPTYDLNALVAGGKDAMAILGDARNLLLNYGIHARGTPGSIFKMVTAMGALLQCRLNHRPEVLDQQEPHL